VKNVKIEKKKLENIILIIVDGLRKDRLGCYGSHKRDISPNIDKLAINSRIFTRCYTVNNMTKPCFAAIYSGVHPLVTEIFMAENNKALENKYETLAEYMKRIGYYTIAFDNLSSGWGNNDWARRGFDKYMTIGKLNEVNNYAEDITQQFIELEKKEPFFAVLHYYDTRRPFYHEKDDEKFLDNYSNAICYLDRYLGKIFDKYTNAKFIVTADHGIELTEDFICDNHGSLKEEIISVPLITNLLERGYEDNLFSQHNIRYLIDKDIKISNMIITADRTSTRALKVITKNRKYTYLEVPDLLLEEKK
jgi:arylsulfatase A-like enzyme